MDGPVSGIGNVISALHRKTTNEKKERKKKNCRRKRKGKPNVPLGLYENDNCSLYKVSQNKNCVARKNTTKKSQTRLLHTEDGLYTEEESFPRWTRYVSCFYIGFKFYCSRVINVSITSIKSLRNAKNKIGERAVAAATIYADVNSFHFNCICLPTAATKTQWKKKRKISKIVSHGEKTKRYMRKSRKKGTKILYIYILRVYIYMCVKRETKKKMIKYRKKIHGTIRDELRDTHFLDLRPKSRQKSGKKIS